MGSSVFEHVTQGWEEEMGGLTSLSLIGALPLYTTWIVSPNRAKVWSASAENVQYERGVEKGGVRIDTSCSLLL